MYLLKLSSIESCSEPFEWVNDIFHEKNSISLALILKSSL